MEQFKGAMNSEARKKRQEAMGEPEPKLLTEVHPVYTGEIIEMTPDSNYSLCKAFPIEETQRIEDIRAELKQYGA